MTQKRRTTTKTTRKSSAKRKTSRKSKAKLPAYKLVVYCALAVSLCILVYLIADIASASPQAAQSSSITERYEPAAKTDVKTEPPSQKSNTEPVKTNVKVPEVKTSEVKNVTPKKTESKPVTTKTEVKKPQTKPVEVKTPEPKSPAVEQNKFNFPEAKNGAKLVFIFDDGGQNLTHLERFVTLPFPITVAVLPQLANSVAAANRVRSSGNELMLHQPMQSVNSAVNPGPGAITPDMNDAQVISTLFLNVNQIGPIAGLNNHEGSLITADAEKMAIVLQFASEEGIYFLDSRTNVETKVPYVAKEMGYSYYERNIFLDNEKTRDNSLSELNKALTIANKNGYVVMIGHIWSADYLPELLREVYPELVKKGYKFCTVSQCPKLR